MLALASGTRIAVPENAFVDTAGQAITGRCAHRTGVPQPHRNLARRHSDARRWRRRPAQCGYDGNRGTSADGREVELAPNQVLQLDWYSVEDDPGYVMQALDTATGQWTETGTANPRDPDLQAELEEAEAALPPRVNPVPPSRYAFDIGDLTGKQPELDWYRGVQFVPANGKKCGHDTTRIEVEPIADGSGGAFLVRFIVDTVVHMRFKASSFDTLTYMAPYPIDSVTECRCNVALPPGASEREAARVQRLLNGNSDRQRERGRRAAVRLWEEYNATIDRQYLTDLLRPSTLPRRLDRPGRVFSLHANRPARLDRLRHRNPLP